MLPLQELSNIKSPETLAELVSGVYGELIGIAVSFFRGNRIDRAMEPADLVHDTYLRLAQEGPQDYISRGQFLQLAVHQMRRILLEQVRARRTPMHAAKLIAVVPTNLAGAQGRRWPYESFRPQKVYEEIHHASSNDPYSKSV